MTRRTIFDIETAPLPEAECLAYAPELTAPANYKDQAKIDAYIAEARKEWLAKAALSPLTGRVVAIGYLYGDVKHLDIGREEPVMLANFWVQIRAQWTGGQFVGFNIKRFDLPFMVRRSWRCGIKPPPEIRKGRYWDSIFVDLYEEWQLGNYQDSVSLANLSRFLSIGEKSGNGADFHKLGRPEQEAYLLHDLELTAKAANLIL